MIHVDVRTITQTVQCPDGSFDRQRVVVETSTDGAGWKAQATIPVCRSVGIPDVPTARREAEFAARMFVAGARYTGATVRGTSHGGTL